MHRDQQQLGDAIRAARAERGWTVRQLAEAAGVYPSMVTRIETSEVKARADVLAKLAHGLGVDVEDFYALAGFTTPNSLPSLPVYLRAKYNLTPETSARFESLLREVEGDDTSHSPEGTRRNGDRT